MLVIRLRRIGRKHDPHYRIVVTEHTSPVQGKFIDEIGHYHPKSKELVIDAALMTEWLNKGAKPSNTVSRLAGKLEITHKHIVVTQKQAEPKKKAQEAAAAKAEKAAKPEVKEEAVATEPEADAPESTDEVATEADETTAEEVDAPTEEAETATEDEAEKTEE